MDALDGLDLGEAAIGAGDDVLAPTSLAKRTMRSATRRGCSTVMVWWVTTPGIRILPGGSFTFSQTRHSCSWRTLAASIE